MSLPSVAYTHVVSKRGVVEHSAGYGLEIPCKYISFFFGSNLYIERLKTIVDEQRPDGLL